MPVRKRAVADGALCTLVQALRHLHTAAGEPSVRDIARLSGGQVSRDTVHRLLTMTKPPRWRTLAAVIHALDGDVERFRPLWIAARAEEDGESSLRPESTW